MGRRLMASRFFFIDSLRFDNSVTFKMLRHHFLMMFRFCAAVLSIVAFASSRKVTSRCQCILSMHQCPRTARLANSISSFKLLMKITVFHSFFVSLFYGFSLHNNAFLPFPRPFLLQPFDVFCLIILSFSQLTMRFFFRFLVNPFFLNPLQEFRIQEVFSHIFVQCSLVFL